MSHRSRLLILVCLPLAFFACKKEAVLTNPEIKIESKTMLNMAYGDDPLQKMDVYLPTNRTPATKVVIFVHGGSFTGGDKEYYTALVKELVRADFAVLNVNYRLVNGAGLDSYPVKHIKSAIGVKDQVSDMSAVVDFAIAHASEWQVSTSQLAMAGHSAGATLALLYAYDERNTDKIKAVANLAGSLDLTFTDIPGYSYWLPDAVLEAGYRYTGYRAGTGTNSYYKAISPLYVANNSRPVPTLNIFPELNDIDLPKQDKATFDMFTARLNTLNIPNKFVLVPGADHEFKGKGAIDMVLNEIINYFNVN